MECPGAVFDGLDRARSDFPGAIVAKKDMKKFLTFLAVGSFFATVEEFLTVVVLRQDVKSYVFTLLVLFPVFLTLVWFSSRAIGWVARREPARELIHYFVYGFAGLLIEWFLIGLSPWSNPEANPLLMLVFQLGMFSFRATVGFAPRLFTNPGELSRRTRRAVLWFYVPYFVCAYAIAFAVPGAARFPTIIGLILFGYLSLNVFYARYFFRALAQGGMGQDHGAGAGPP